MHILLAIYRNAVWLAPPALCLAVVLLGWSIFNIVMLVRKSVIARLPLAEVQEVDFTQAGDVILCMEGPLLSSRFKGLGYRMTDGAGNPLRGRGVIPVSSSSFSRGRRTLWRFEIPQAGRYLFHVERLGEPRPNDTDHEFLFTRPHFAKVVAYVLAIIFSAHLFIGSIVIFALRLLDKNPELSAASALPSKTVISVLIVVGFFATGFLLMIWSTRSHQNAVHQLAASQGWPISEGDTLGLAPLLERLIPDRSYTCSLTMTVESGQRRVYLVDGSYSDRGPKTDAHLASICLLESDRLRNVTSRVEIRPQNWIDKAMLPEQVILDDSEFTRQYMVISDAPSAARYLLNTPLQRVLLDHAAQPLYNPVEIAIDQGRMALITTYISENERWLDLLDLAKKIESAL